MQVDDKQLRSFFGGASNTMADVSGKTAGVRRAIAVGSITISAAAMDALLTALLPKGDPRPLAEFAAICAAKQTPSLLPLCHPLSLDQVMVRVVTDGDSNRLHVVCCAAATAVTGVEMEALTSVQVGLLCLYDLIKPVDPAPVIDGVRLVSKEGGKKGDWLHPLGVPDFLDGVIIGDAASAAPRDSNKQSLGTAMTITVSDRCSTGEREDTSGPLLAAMLSDLGLEVVQQVVVPDNVEDITAMVKHATEQLKVNCLATTGGTGAAPRDVTPDAIVPLCHRILPGYGERMRSYGANSLIQAYLSRSFVGVRDGTMIIVVPGSTGGVRDSINAIGRLIPDTLTLIRGMGCSDSC